MHVTGSGDIIISTYHDLLAFVGFCVAGVSYFEADMRAAYVVESHEGLVERTCEVEWLPYSCVRVFRQQF